MELTPVSNLYYTEVMYESLLSLTDIHEDLYNRMYEEKEILTEANEDASQQPKAKMKSLVSSKSLLGRLRDFIKKVWEAFKGNSAKFHKLYNRWLTKIKANIDTVNFNNLSVTLDENYMGSEEKIKAARNHIIKVNAVEMDKIKAQTMDEFTKTPMVAKYIDENGSLAGGMKNLFRYGSAKPNLRNKKYTGDALKQIAQQAIDFCLSYETVVSSLNNLSTNIQNVMKSAESIANREESTTESYFVIDESIKKFNNLNIHNCPKISMVDILREAEENNDKNASTAPKMSTGEVKDDNGQPGDVKTNDEENNEAVNNMNKSQAKTLTFVCQYMQILFASALTVSEERYNLYIKMLKYAFGKSKFKYETDATRNGEQDIVDKDANNATDDRKNVRGKVQQAKDNIKNKFTRNKS